MAFYVKIVKTHEDEVSATYRFGRSESVTGTLRFTKQDGQCTLLTPMPGDEKGHYFTRATVRLSRDWVGGRLPDETEWAS